jgi:vanillate O-demethylase monooxygenase subunit
MNASTAKVADEWPLSKNQDTSRANEFDKTGEERLYKALKNFWHPVLFTSELGASPQRVTLCGIHVVVVRLNGKVHAYNDLCAHRGTALSLGKVVSGPQGEELRCPYHGWQYNQQGNCTLAPQRPDLAGRIRARIKQFNCAECYGMIWVCLADKPYFPIPEFKEWDDESYQKVVIPSDIWQCSAPRRTENYTDLGHFAIVHDGWLGDVNHPAPPKHKVWRDKNAVRIETLEPKREPGAAKYGIPSQPGTDGLVDTWQNWWIFMPLTVTFNQTAPGNRDYVLFFHPSPIGPKTIRNFTIAARNYGNRETAAKEVISFTQTIYAQDIPIVESQRPEELPEDLSAEMHLGGVDTPQIEYRKWLLELVNALVPKELSAI